VPEGSDLIYKCEVNCTVKRHPEKNVMWIGEFSAAAGLPVGTVRFYVRSGLLHPRLGAAGGSRPYLEFSARDLRLVASIRAGQALGLSLTEIRSLMDERRVGGGSAKMLRTMVAQREKLRRRAAELEALIGFVDAKIAWLQTGRAGPVPEPPMAADRSGDPARG